MKSTKKALFIAKAASDKKAFDIVIIDMRKAPSVSDYFVIVSGASARQLKAVQDNIIKRMYEKWERPWHIEGEEENTWLLLDYGDVVVHLFYDETRKFYDLERLWGDLPQERFKERRARRKRGYAKKRRRA